MKDKSLSILVTLIIIYFLLKYIIPFWDTIIYPINLFVTFLHEFWHALFALLTGWSVLEVEVNSDGSGLATTSGWWRSFVLMGGYIGSAIFGNILLRIWLKDTKNLSERILYALAVIMILVWIIWFSSIISFVILVILSAILAFLAKYTSYDKIILQFLGVASVLFIIEDFNVGPSSDLSKFSDIFVVIPEAIWMIVWLIVVLVITGLNLRSIFAKK